MQQRAFRSPARRPQLSQRPSRWVALWMLAAAQSVCAASPPSALPAGSAVEPLLAADSKTTPALTCSPEVLAGLSAAELRVMRNFVFARYGRSFASADLKALFGSVAWYHPDPAYSDARLQPADKACVDAVGAAESKAKAGAVLPPANSAPVRLWVSGGYLDASGKVAMSRIGLPFREGLALISNEKRKAGYMDTAGKVVIKPAYDDGHDFSEGFAAVQMGERWGFIDRKGRWLVRPTYRAVRSFHEGLAWVWDDGAWAYINTQGQVAIPSPCPNYQCPVLGNGSEEAWQKACRSIGYDEVELDKGGTAWLKTDGELGYIYTTGCRDTRDFSEGLAAVIMNDKVGFIDRAGKLVVPAVFSSAGDFSEGLAWVFDPRTQNTRDSRYFIDQTGEVALRPKAGAGGLGTFRQGLAPFSDYSSDLWGYLDKRGNVVMAPRFQQAESFDCELAPVQVGKRWGLIDRRGTLVVAANHASMARCYEGFLEVRDVVDGFGTSHWVDRTGAVVGKGPP